MDLHRLITKPSTRLFLSLIILLSIALRFAAFPAIPAGINQDEAAAGYESYSLIHHQTDRWGNKWPAYFVAWGSGQNVLESYLEMPVIALFGLTTFAIRIIPALLGVGAVVLLFFLVRKVMNVRLALLSSLLLAVLPWAVLSSRWGLESNILPFFMLLGAWAFVYSYESPRVKYFMPLSLIPFALALYAYAIAVFVIPFFLLGMFYLYRDVIRKNLPSFITSLAVFLVIATPILTFFGVNMVLHRSPHALTHLPFSAPLLLASRLDQVNGGRFDANVHFLSSGFVDNVQQNMPVGFAPLALIPIPLALLGCIFVLREGSRRAKVFSVWLLAGCAELFVAGLNLNRANTVMIPMIVLSVYAVVAIYKEIRDKEKKRIILVTLVSLATVFCVLFYHDYFTKYNKETASDFNVGFSQMLQKARSEAKPGQKIYISNQINLNYVYTLFYLRSDSLDFQKNADYHIAPSPIGNYYQVEHFHQYYFNPLNSDLLNDKNYVFIAKGGEVPSCKSTHTSYSDDLWRVGVCHNPIKPPKT